MNYSPNSMRIKQSICKITFSVDSPHKLSQFIPIKICVYTKDLSFGGAGFAELNCSRLAPNMQKISVVSFSKPNFDLVQITGPSKFALLVVCISLS